MSLCRACRQRVPSCRMEIWAERNYQANRSFASATAVRYSKAAPRDSTRPPQEQARHAEIARAGQDRSEESAVEANHRHQYNYDPFTLTPSEDHYTYPLVKADELARSNKRPRKVRMLASDFIQDSLYNPHYGYFSRQAVLLPSLKQKLEGEQRGIQEEDRGASAVGTESRRWDVGFDFGTLRNEFDFMKAVEQRYSSFEHEVEEQEKAKGLSTAATQTFRPTARQSSAEGLEEAQKWGRAMAARGAVDAVSESDVMAMAARQVWHTPTELFKPHYAESLARYLVNEYKHGLFPYKDLVVYEVGAGSGTLAQGILGYLEAEEPEVYQRTRYNIVEISSRLADQQLKRLRRHNDAGRLNVVKRSILDWNEPVSDSCFVIALEVLDNLPHDVVRFHTGTLQPYQALVSIDDSGDMHELWEPVSDPTIAKYLALSARPGGTSTLWSSGLRALKTVPAGLRNYFAEHFPFYPNLSQAHYLPTSMLKMMDVLNSYFPSHRLIISDFSALPDAVPGVNAPVVQTRFKGTMIPVTTYRVLQGFFDIFFPTNFDDLRHAYLQVVAQSDTHRNHEPSGDQPHASLRPNFFTSGFRGDRARAPTSGDVRILSHADFLRENGRIEEVQLRDGTNPMLTWYANAKWLLS